MKNTGKLSGFYWHWEYHTTDAKKEKAADCIYLTNDRICQNKTSTQYLAKCFMASSCPFRVKIAEKEQTQRKKEIEQLVESQKKETSKYEGIRCSLPLKCRVFSTKYGKGKFLDYHETNRIISIQFGENTRDFKYPEAILEKHLFLPKFAFQRVLMDISKAKKGK